MCTKWLHVYAPRGVGMADECTGPITIGKQTIQQDLG